METTAKQKYEDLPAFRAADDLALVLFCETKDIGDPDMTKRIRNLAYRIVGDVRHGVTHKDKEAFADHVSYALEMFDELSYLVSLGVRINLFEDATGKLLEKKIEITRSEYRALKKKLRADADE